MSFPLRFFRFPGHHRVMRWFLPSIRAFSLSALLLIPSGVRADFSEARDAFVRHELQAEPWLREVAQKPDTTPSDRRDAFHLLGIYYLQAGRFAASVASYQEALTLGEAKGEAPTPLEDQLHFGLAKAHAQLPGEEAKAIFHADWVTRDPHSPLRFEAAFLAATLSETFEGPSKALERYKAIQARWPESTRVREIERRIERLTQPLHLSTTDTPTPSLTLAGPQEGLHPLKRPPSLEQLRTFLRQRHFEAIDEGLAIWFDSLEAQPSLATTEGLYEDLLEISLENDIENYRYDKALQTSHILQTRGRKGLSAKRNEQVQALSGDFAEAKASLKRRLKGKAYYAALGDLAYEFAEYDEARQAWLKAFGKAKVLKNPTDKMLWALLRSGNVKEAAKHWEDAAKVRGAGKQLFERYWYARAQALSGNTQEAKRIWQGIADDSPIDYYGLQAASRLMELNNTVPKAAPTPTPTVPRKGSEPLLGRSTVHWSEESLVGAFDQVPKALVLSELTPLAERFASTWGPHAQEAKRAAAHIRLGQLEAAIEELRVLDMDLRSLRSKNAHLTHRTRSFLLDNRRTSLAPGGESMKSEVARRTEAQERAIKQESAALRADLRELQVALADPYAIRRKGLEDGWRVSLDALDSRGRMLFPMAYAPIVESLSEQLGIPPYFFYAIMTVESSYHPGAVSVANAYGLVQVIPRTGEHLARELGYLDFTPERLLDPATSLYFGGYYLSRLLARFSSQEPLAAAAYNAGPHRVTTWLKARGNIPLDMFIEDIPYDQARNYTKRTFEHMASYRYVYHSERDFYIRNTIDTRLGEGPNY